MFSQTVCQGAHHCVEYEDIETVSLVDSNVEWNWLGAPFL